MSDTTTTPAVAYPAGARVTVPAVDGAGTLVRLAGTVAPAVVGRGYDVSTWRYVRLDGSSPTVWECRVDTLAPADDMTHTPATDRLAAAILATRKRAGAYAAGANADRADHVRARADGMALAWQLVTGSDADPAWSDELALAARRAARTRLLARLDGSSA